LTDIGRKTAIFFLALYAMHLTGISQEKRGDSIIALRTEADKSPVDVLHYDIYLTIDPATKTIFARSKLEI
jgi:hypothetical protein